MFSLIKKRKFEVTVTKKNFRAIGLMSGTSMDGVDCAFIESDGHSVKAIGKSVHIPYAEDLRRDITAGMAEAKRLSHPSKMNASLFILEKRLTDIHGEAVQICMKGNKLTKNDVDIIGFHGQTLRHQPEDGWSWQIGDGQRLANRLQIPVVHDFRRYDVENGGQGAPLVPIYHRALIKALAKPDYPIAIINIGGVSNMTWVGGEQEDGVMAFDTGPGNAFLDDWVKQHTGAPMDRDGILASKGCVHDLLLENWLQNPYFLRPPPKSLDRHSFSQAGLENLSLADGAATLMAFTLKSIEKSLNLCPRKPKYIYICGGGRHNKKLMADLKRGGIPAAPVECLGWDGDFLEAEAFAFLACRHLLGLPITFPGTTGISQPSPGGALSLPEGALSKPDLKA